MSDIQLYGRHGQPSILEMARMLKGASLLPAHLKTEGDIVIALMTAHELGQPVITVIQEVHVVGGRVGFSAKFMLAQLNKSGLLRRSVQTTATGTGKDMEVSATFEFADGTTHVETVSMAMAEAEGWTKNSKYRTDPATMLRWRAIARGIRFTHPEIAMGLYTPEELEDISIADQRPATSSQSNTIEGVIEAKATLAEAAAPADVIEKVVNAYAAIGCGQTYLEEQFGAPISSWTMAVVAKARSHYAALKKEIAASSQEQTDEQPQ